MSLNLIHLTWLPELDAFDNIGHFLLWIESAEAAVNRNRKGYYQYAAKLEAVNEFVDHWLVGCRLSQHNAEVELPIDKKGQVVPSPVIANHLSLEVSNIAETAPYVIEGLRPY